MDEAPLRVLVLSSRYPDRERPYRGNFVQRQMIELAARPGVALEVVAPLDRSLSPFSHRTRLPELDALPARETWKGIEVHRPVYPVLRPFPAMRPVLLARRLLPLVRSIRARFRFDLVSAEFAWPEWPAAARLGQALGVPVSMKARGSDFEAYATNARLGRLLLAATRSAAGLLAVSEDVKAAMIAAGVPADAVEVHYPAVDTELFRITDRAAAKRALKVEGPLLLAVGNLTRNKRPSLAVEALKHLPEATLIVAGGGPEEADLRRRIAALGLEARVRLLGGIPHELLPTFYAAADALIHCPQIEGLANVRLEALACGTPLVTTAVGEARRLVRSPAQGRIVPPEPEAIAAAAADFIAGPPVREAVRAVALEFSWERATAQLEAHFRRVAAARRGAG
ncbi:MAG TPA: glycosyltransferase [Allosphingosinicella sp.]|nr:glycosyltransferase [Allosphingosinicella sp.]